MLFARETKGFGRLLTLASLVLISALWTSEPLSAETPEDVLFVGNSFSYYNNGLQNHYRRLLNAASTADRAPGKARLMTISGGRLPEHRGGLGEMLRAYDWDAVVLQGYSLGPIDAAMAEPFREAAREYAEWIRADGAEPVFFMTWAYLSRPEMTATLDAAYTAIGRELDARVVPVGRAFAAVREERGDIALIMDDDKHPTLAGTYLAACTFFAALTGTTPAGLDYTAGLDRTTAAYLQSVAWRTVEEYAARQ